VITDLQESAEQVIRMIREGRVRSRCGDDVAIQADTICLHGDGPHAIELVQCLRAALATEGIVVRAPGATGSSTRHKSPEDLP
jgi:5-oxoprolinase (ATP-hydrolysing) subunit A